jgi:hypothetical protein
MLAYGSEPQMENPNKSHLRLLALNFRQIMILILDSATAPSLLSWPWAIAAISESVMLSRVFGLKSATFWPMSAAVAAVVLVPT